MINYIHRLPAVNRQVKNDSCKSAKYGGWYCENSDTAIPASGAILQLFIGSPSSVQCSFCNIFQAGEKVLQNKDAEIVDNL